jgi:DHA1 family tetracycline resistance protein-like MFS transporter
MAKTGLNTQRVLPIFVLVFVDVLGLTVILPLLHLYGAAYGASPLEIGLIAAAFPLAQLIGVPVMGMLSDRFGRKPLLLISQITTCISFIMLGFANSLAMVIFSRLFDGLFGANIATAQAALSDVTDESNRSAGLGLTGAAFGLGFIFGPLISLLALEATDSLAVPALSAAIYSAISILLTLFLFEETLPPEKRQQQSGDNKAHQSRLSPVIIWGYLRQPQIGFLLVLMFAQQVIFFGFESLMGLFTLSRLGILGQGNAILFLIIGTVLVIVQVRFIGRWTQRWGEMRVAQVALGLLASGLILVALTPQQPQPFYVQARVQYELAQQAPSSTEAILGDLGVELPAEGNNGIIGIVWMAVMIVPLSVGAGLIRPALNSLMTKQVSQREYGAILGVSAANATAPIVGVLFFQRAGTSTPVLFGGIMMALLWSISLLHLRRSSQA